MAGHVSHTDLSGLAASHTPNTFGHHPQARKLATSETTIWRASGGSGNLPSSENTKLSLVSRSSWDTRDAANVKTALADITDLRIPGWSQAQTIDDESPQGDWPTPSSWVAMEVSTFQKLRKRLLWHFNPFLILPHLWSPFFYIFGSIFTLLYFSFIFILLHRFT